MRAVEKNNPEKKIQMEEETDSPTIHGWTAIKSWKEFPELFYSRFCYLILKKQN